MLNKNPPLAQHRQNIDISNPSSGWQADVGPTSAKSADHATNSQRRSNGRMLSGSTYYTLYMIKLPHFAVFTTRRTSILDNEAE